jgi:hypothetical protein
MKISIRNQVKAVIVNWFFLSLLLMACSTTYNNANRPPISSIYPVVTNTPTSDEKISTATHSASSIVNNTFIPTNVSKPSSTPIPSSSLAYPFPLPENTQEVQNLILQLSKNNAGCQLPCWWGIIPGKTSWKLTQDNLLPYAIKIMGSDFNALPGTKIHTAYFSVPIEYNSRGILIQTYTVKSDQIEMIEVNPINTPRFFLSALLYEYGMPNRILVRTFKEAREGKLPFYLLLYYPNDGFMAVYRNDAKLQDGDVISCPEGIQPDLWLWAKSNSLTLDDIALFNTGYFTPEERPFYLSIEDVTEMSIPSFYKYFTTTKDSCIKTPKNIWPTPN